MRDRTPRRVVITGLGAVAPNGIGKEAFWRATSQGVSGIKPLSRMLVDDLPITAGGEVQDFVAQDFLDRKLAQRTDRVTHFAFAAVQEALQDAALKLEEENSHRVGAVIANTVGGVEFVLTQVEALHTRGPRFVSAYTAIAWLQVATVGQLSIRYGIQGYCKTPLNDTAGGLEALGKANQAVRRGAADVILAGGCEAMLHPCVLLVMAHSGHCATGDDLQAYRPFDKRASGFMLAEGAGVCIVEEYEHALRRGAPIYGELVGFGQSNDAQGTQMSTSRGAQYARAIQSALCEGQLAPQEIGYFSLDGRAIPNADQAEAEALHSVFGDHLERIALSVPRTMLGHSHAAAGALDTIAALLALQHHHAPPTINCEQVDPRYGLSLVGEGGRPLTGSGILVGGRSTGGVNSVLALRPA
ncbi:MAG TPA: beta-ketoacyl-[acyl-carrier-protein] synthase family protein [Ktedonobacteraceae bacterium]|nr:beta-ketoacyl-[acyl-carrier-protein] synthase family protein [Ktedonobacteraceae bacterium]